MEVALLSYMDLDEITRNSGFRQIYRGGVLGGRFARISTNKIFPEPLDNILVYLRQSVKFADTGLTAFDTAEHITKPDIYHEAHEVHEEMQGTDYHG
jgi:hypothetical protein